MPGRPVHCRKRHPGRRGLVPFRPSGHGLENRRAPGPDQRLPLYYKNRRSHHRPPPMQGLPQDGHNAILAACSGHPGHAYRLSGLPGSRQAQRGGPSPEAPDGTWLRDRAVLQLETRGDHGDRTHRLWPGHEQLKGAAEMFGCTVDTKIMGSASGADSDDALEPFIKSRGFQDPGDHPLRSQRRLHWLRGRRLPDVQSPGPWRKGSLHVHRLRHCGSPPQRPVRHRRERADDGT